MFNSDLFQCIDPPPSKKNEKLFNRVKRNLMNYPWVDVSSWENWQNLFPMFDMALNSEREVNLNVKGIVF